MEHVIINGWSLVAGALIALLSGWLGYYFWGRNRADDRRFKDQINAIESHIAAFRDTEYQCSLVNFRLVPAGESPETSKYALDACTKIIETYNQTLRVRHRIPDGIFDAMGGLHLKMRAIMAKVAAEQCQPEGMKRVPEDLRKEFAAIDKPLVEARHMLEREYQWMVRMKRRPWWQAWREHAPITANP